MNDIGLRIRAPENNLTTSSIVFAGPGRVLGLRVISSSSGVIELREGFDASGRLLTPANKSVSAGDLILPFGAGIAQRVNGLYFRLVSGTATVAPLFIEG